MFSIVRPDINIDFLGKSKTFLMVSAISVALALVVIFTLMKLGLDFSGGHEVLVSFEKQVDPTTIRSKLEALNLGETSVQSYEIPGSSRVHYLVRVQRTQTFGAAEIASLEKAFKDKYGEHFKPPLRYNPDAGDVIEVDFASTATSAAAMAQGVSTSTATMIAVVEGTNHPVRHVKKIGRPDQLRYSIVLKGVDSSVITQLQKEVDASARAEKVEFVGPTVGRQLRDDGILAVLYALLGILIYVALRFDFFYAPGAVIPLFHDAILTVGVVTLLGEEFSLSTIAGILTLVGYSINDTIVIFDRVREVVGKAEGEALTASVNRAINETFGRTLVTNSTVIMSCLCLMVLGRGTVLYTFGVIMLVGGFFGTYSTIYIAAPIFIALKQRFGAKPIVGASTRPTKSTKRPAGGATASGTP